MSSDTQSGISGADQPLRVILVEDDDDDAAAVLRVLRGVGYRAISERAETADEMSALLERGAWDVVLSDHDMPRFSSTEALKLVRDRGLDLPFVIVSGNISEAVVVGALKAGAQDFVSKNDLSRLGPAIERARREIRERLQRREAEEALRQSEERFALALAASRDGIWDWNLRTNRVHCSPRCVEMLELDTHNLDGGFDSLVALLAPDERARLSAAMTEHLEREAPFDAEFEYQTREGTMSWFCTRGMAVRDQATGIPTRIVGALSDITPRKLVESELRDQLDVIVRQKEDIRALSAPIVEVWYNVLMVPIIGALDRERTEVIMSTLLDAITRAQCGYAIIDLTAVASIDAATANQLIQIISAVQLLGAQGIVVGIRPNVAQAIVSLGADLASVITLANVRTALVHCMKRERMG